MIEVWRHHRAIGNMIVSGLVGIFLVLLLTNVYRTSELVSAIRYTQKTNTSLARETHANTALIKSCVNSNGDCYKRNAQRTNDAVGTLNQYILLSASCSAHIATATHGLEGISQTDLTKLIAACVRSQLSIEQSHR